MALSNEEALENLIKQKVQLEEQFVNIQNTYTKIVGAIEVLEQLVEEAPKGSFDQGGEVTDFGEEATLAGE